MSDIKCQACGGSGVIEVEVTVTIPVCCGEILPDGSCCGNAIAGQGLELRQGQCPYCDNGFSGRVE